MTNTRSAGAMNHRTAFAALVLGAVAMGISPVFVRFSEIGPIASAFWRVALALPALWLWAYLEKRNRGDYSNTMPGAQSVDAGARQALFLAGLLFSGDLAFWHLAILNTSVANATFLATLAPVWVIVGSGLFLQESVSRPVWAGLGLCLAGAALLIGETLSVNPGRLTGDLYGVATSFFFGAYFLAVRRARRAYGSGQIMLVSSLVCAFVLLALALFSEPVLVPTTLAPVAALLALALVSHAGGQGLLALALGHLPAAFSSLVIFLEAIAAALFGWLFLSEAISGAQAAGALVIFAGIYVARPGMAARR
ncbi:MAG: DMT family transporter [Alphaproteobacteria bacterium]